MYFQLPGTRVRLLGSMHLFPATFRRTPPWVAQAYEWAETLVFESDPPTILPFLKAPPSATSTAGQLRAHVPPEAWQRLQSAWPGEGPLAPLDDLRPWAALVIAPTLFQQVVEGVEPRMLRAAMTEGKPYEYLETAADVAATLDPIPMEALGAALRALMADLDEPQRTLEQMHAAWLEGNVQKVYGIAALSPMFNLGEIRRAVLDARNRAWAQRLKARFIDTRTDAPTRAPRTLIVVGALHLCGPGNLLACLGEPFEPVPTTA